MLSCLDTTIYALFFLFFCPSSTSHSFSLRLLYKFIRTQHIHTTLHDDPLVHCFQFIPPCHHLLFGPLLFIFRSRNYNEKSCGCEIQTRKIKKSIPSLFAVVPRRAIPFPRAAGVSPCCNQQNRTAYQICDICEAKNGDSLSSPLTHSPPPPLCLAASGAWPCLFFFFCLPRHLPFFFFL